MFTFWFSLFVYIPCKILVNTGITQYGLSSTNLTVQNPSSYDALADLNLMVNLQFQTEKRSASLKEKLASVTPLVEDLKMKKDERMKQFADIKAQIEKIDGEIAGYNHVNNTMTSSLALDELDLSLRKLTECQTHLRTLQKEKVSM
jgi:hypothetical protein